MKRKLFRPIHLSLVLMPALLSSACSNPDQAKKELAVFASTLTLQNAESSSAADKVPFNSGKILFDGLPCKKNPLPGPDKQARGTATFRQYEAGGKIKIHYKVAFNKLSGAPIMSHIHLGPAAGKLGPVVQTLCGPPPPDLTGPGGHLGHSEKPSNAKCPGERSGTIEGHFQVNGNRFVKGVATQALELEKLKTGKLMVNIHTCLNQHGEIAGQIEAESRTTK